MCLRALETTKRLLMLSNRAVTNISRMQSYREHYKVSLLAPLTLNIRIGL